MTEAELKALKIGDEVVFDNEPDRITRVVRVARVDTNNLEVTCKWIERVPPTSSISFPGWTEFEQVVPAIYLRPIPRPGCSEPKAPAPYSFAPGDEVACEKRGLQFYTVVSVEGDGVWCECNVPSVTEGSAGSSRRRQRINAADLKMVAKAPKTCSAEPKSALSRDVQLTEAILKADRLRAQHNGIMGVYLYLGHDGDNVCEFKDSAARAIASSCSGRSLLEAVEWCEEAWRLNRFWKDSGGTLGAVERMFGDIGVALRPGMSFTTKYFIEYVQLKSGASVDPDAIVNLLSVEKRLVRLAPGDEWVVLAHERHG